MDCSLWCSVYDHHWSGMAVRVYPLADTGDLSQFKACQNYILSPSSKQCGGGFPSTTKHFLEDTSQLMDGCITAAHVRNANSSEGGHTPNGSRDAIKNNSSHTRSILHVYLITHLLTPATMFRNSRPSCSSSVHPIPNCHPESLT